MIRVNSLLLSSVINLLYSLCVDCGFMGLWLISMHSYVEAGLIYAFTTYTANFFNPMVNMMDNLSFCRMVLLLRVAEFFGFSTVKSMRQRSILMLMR